MFWLMGQCAQTTEVNRAISTALFLTLLTDSILYPIQIGQRYYKAAHAITKTAIQ